MAALFAGDSAGSGDGPAPSCADRSASPSSAGCSASQILTLYTTPVIYLLIDRLRRRDGPGSGRTVGRRRNNSGGGCALRTAPSRAYSGRTSKQSKPDAGSAAAETTPDCPRCLKPLPLCICDSVTAIDNRISLLILQNPQEQDRALGTARLTALHFKNAAVKIGLSWPEPLQGAGAAGRRFLALGGALSRLREGRRPARRTAKSSPSIARAKSRTITPSSKTLGIVLLDGTWSQAKRCGGATRGC
jgi:hypothetical protein